MKKIAVVFLLGVLFSCQKKIEFKLDQEVWSVEELNNSLDLIKYRENTEDTIPNLHHSNPDYQKAFLKLVDKENYRSVMLNETNGIEYKKNFSKEFQKYLVDLMAMYSLRETTDAFFFNKEAAMIHDLILCFSIDMLVLQANPDVKDKESVYASLKDFNESIDYIFDILLKDNVLNEDSRAIYIASLEVNLTKVLEECVQYGHGPVIGKLKRCIESAKSDQEKEVFERLLPKFEEMYQTVSKK
jgi:hypothetical protein